MVLGPILVRFGNQILDDQFQRTQIIQTPTGTSVDQVQCLPEVDSGIFSNVETMAVTQEDEPSINLRMEEHIRADQHALELPAAEDQHNLVEEGIKRRVDVLNYVRNGDIHSPKNLVYAAFIFQHGNCPDHYLLANKLSRKALGAGDEEARWIFAASLDRYLMSLGEPQKYGTQYTWTRDGFGLYPVDPNTTDSERAQYNVPPLQQAADQQAVAREEASVQKRQLETWWLTLIGVGYAFLAALIAFTNDQSSRKLGWLVLVVAILVFILSMIGHVFQLKGLQQGKVEDQRWVWNLVNSLMIILWLSFASYEAFRLMKRKQST